jgi:inorganic pyrophosphatase/exopolyphosphatase
MKVLDSVSIRTDQLLYTTMIPNLYNSNHSFALYDHNFRSELQNNNIFSILDHHTYDPGNVNCSHIINHCGSTLTLLYYLYYP